MKSCVSVRAVASGVAAVALTVGVLSVGVAAPVVAAPAPSDPPVVSAPGAVSSSEVEATDRFVVTYRDEDDAPAVPAEVARQDAALTEAFAQVSGSVAPVRETGTGARVWALDDVVAVDAVEDVAAQIVAQDASIESVVPDVMVSVGSAAPNDGEWWRQWGGAGAPGVDLLGGAWDVTRGAGVTVAVLDTGYRPHEDFGSALVGEYDMVSALVPANDGDGRDGDARDPGYSEEWCPSQWHGTHVTGTIAAREGNGIGVAGVAPEVDVLQVRILGACGGYMSDAMDGLIWASGGAVPGVPSNQHPADVANLSMGARVACSGFEQAAVDVARANGTVVVAAAMNSAEDVALATPASCAGVVAVAAHDASGGRAGFSNFGAGVALSAPGVNVISTYNTGGATPGVDAYGYMSGTSMAAPHVAGAAALVRAADPTLSVDQVAQVLRDTARPSSPWCDGCGAGELDVTAAVRAVTGSTPVSPTPVPSVSVSPSAAPSSPAPSVPVPSSTPVPSVCSAPAWQAGQTYTGGERAADGGRLWEAKWWTFAERPTSAVTWGPWKDLGSC
ncbi:hypothetical protein Slu03_14790 [Sediminihabitans luteus]|nr:hypothetical protein Slu03_14790 [Sediminihabitans luteus]